MKKMKKLLAGLLSFAMVASTLPIMPIGVSAQTLPSDTYLYYEGFEEPENYYAGWNAKDYSESTYKTVDAEGNETTKNRQNLYTSELVTENGNTFMRYTKNRDTSLAWYNYSGTAPGSKSTTETTVTEGTTEESTTTELVSFTSTQRVVKTTTVTNGTMEKDNGDGTTSTVDAYTTTVVTTTYTYGANNSYSFFDAQQIGSNAQGGGVIDIESNTNYEMGFKLDPHQFNGYLNGGIGLAMRGPYGRCNQTFGALKFNAGGVSHSGSGMSEQVANIDGFINVRVALSFGEISKTAANNGTADVYISYTKTDGTFVEKEQLGASIKTGDGQFYLDRFTGLSGSEWTNGYSDTEENYIDIDDVYFKKQESFNLTLDAGAGSFAEGTEGLDEDGNVLYVNNGIVLEDNKIPVPEMEDGAFAWWCTDAELKNKLNADNLAEADTDGDGNITLYAKYDVVYTVTFDVNGGDALETDTYSTASGEMPEEEIPTPTNGAYRFVGWFLDDGTEWDGTIGSNFTVKAKWDGYVIDVDFENDDYDTEWNLKVPELGEQRWFSEVVTLEDGNKAMKYYYDGEGITKQANNSKLDNSEIDVSYARADAPLDRNTTYEAGYSVDYSATEGRFNGIDMFKLSSSFRNNPKVALGGQTDTTFGSATTYKIGSASIKQADVDGFVDVRITFNMNGDTQTDDNKSTNGTYTRTVSYTKKDGTPVLVTDSGTFASKGAADVDSFQGMYLTDYYGSATVGSYFLMDDIYVKVQETPVDVHFVTNVDGLEIADMAAANGVIAEVPTIEETDSYAFHGWYLDEACTVPFKNAHVFEETTLYAKIVGDSVVTFMNGDEVFATATAENGLVDMTAIADPTLEGSEFLGWNLASDGSGEYINENTIFDKNTTVYAIYKGIVTVTFNANGGVEEDQTADTLTGETVEALPANPTREGYHFLSWNTSADGTGTEFTTETVVNASMTVYAKWQKAIEVTFTVGYEGAEEIPVVYAALDGKVTLPTEPKRTGYIFDGWYAGENEVTADTVFTADTTVTAAWLEAWIVSYDTGVAGVSVADGYAAFETGAIEGEIPTPTRGGYTFTGWVTADGATFDGTGVTADMTVYATWAVDETKTWGGMIYSQTFEDDCTTDQTPFAAKSNDRWSAEVVEVDGNKVMKYSVNTATAATKQSIMSTAFARNANGVPMGDLNMWHEYGVTLDLRNLTGDYESIALLDLDTRWADRHGITAKIANGKLSMSRSEWAYHHGREVTGSIPSITLSDVDSPIDFKFFVNLQKSRTTTETADVVAVISYINKAGEKVVVEDSYSFTRWASGTSDDHSAKYVKGLAITESATSAATEGSYFTVDNMYLKVIDKPTAVTLNMGDTGIELADAVATNGYVTDLPIVKYVGDYTIHGWYLDAALTQPFVQGEFTGTTLYADIDKYVLDVDFEGETYDSHWDLKATSGTQKWFNEVVTLEDGRKAMKYYTVSSDGDKSNLNVTYGYSYGLEEILLDRNKTYEAGYRMDLTNLKGRFNGMNLFRLTGEHNNNPNVDLSGLGDRNFGNPTVKIGSQNVAMSEVDGFIDVRITFSMNGATQTTENRGSNGTYTRTISYTKTDGTPVMYTDAGTFASAAAGTVRAFQGFNLSDYSIGADEYFLLDDIYIRVAADAVPVHFVSNVDGITFSDTTAMNGIVANVPTIENTNEYVFDGWFLDAACTIPFVNGEITEETTLYAKISDCCAVTFYTTTKDFAAGNAYAVKYTSTDKVEMPETPTNPGYEFLGWFVADENGNATAVAFDGTNVPETGLNVVATWDGNYFSEDFEGETYNSLFDYPIDETIGGNTLGGRWWNAVETDENGNKYMNYMLMDNTIATGNSTPVVDARVNQTVDPNAWYEFGFKVDVDTTAYFNNMLGLSFVSAYNEVTTLGNWSHNNGATTMTFTGGVDENGVSKKVAIAQADVDGFVTIKYQFCLFANGEATSTAPNVGEAVVYISYMNTSGERVNETVYFHNFSAAQTNSNGLCSLKTNLRGISANEWQSSSTAAKNGDTIKLDDVYLIAKPAPKVVTFESNGGSAVDYAEADGNGIIVLPTAPTKQGVAFAGWFRDTALTIPFDGTEVYNDMTVYARWQEAPEVAKVTPADTKAVALRPEITVEFDSELDSATINKNNVKIVNKDGIVFDTASYEVAYSIDAADRHSIVKVTFNANLDFDAEYDLVISKKVTNSAGEMAEDYTLGFKTRKMWLEAYDWNVTNTADDTAVTAVEAAGGKTINIQYFIDLGVLN